jgi:ATP-dependent Lhr-like helicase
MEEARRADAAVESAARMLLARYGVVFRDLVARESNLPRWGTLLRMLRRLEDRGEVRGGRFVSGFGGEQFALPEIIDSLRASPRRDVDESITIAGADPMNLFGVLIPGERVAAVPGRSGVYRAGLEPAEGAVPAKAQRVRAHRWPAAAKRMPAAEMSRPGESLRLF